MARGVIIAAAAQFLDNPMPSELSIWIPNVFSIQLQVISKVKVAWFCQVSKLLDLKTHFPYRA
jgi:hypothetical protein